MLEADRVYVVLGSGAKVEAFRHKNPDGSLGGWVTSNSHVDGAVSVHRDAFVGPDISIEGAGAIPAGVTVLNMNAPLAFGD